MVVGKEISKRHLPEYLPDFENQGCHHRPYNLEAQKRLHSLIRRISFRQWARRNRGIFVHKIVLALREVSRGEKICKSTALLPCDVMSV